MSFGSTVKLNSSGGAGITIPQIGLGTWLSAPKEVEKAVESALKEGYRHLDLAKVYGNQDEVAAGIKKSGIDRSQIFITSKLWNKDHRPDQVEAALDDTLKELQLDYLDLYLIHFPVSFKSGSDLFPKEEGGKKVALDLETSLVDTWKAVIELQKTGKVKAIGVSNFQVPHLEGIIKATGVVPAVNQIERHPLLLQKEVIDYSNSKGIHITAYSPLGNNTAGETKIVDYPEVAEVAKKKNVDPAQILIAWGKAGGISVIPKSVTPSRIKSNFQEVELTKEEVDAINKIGENKTKRFNVPYEYNPVWDINIFDEADKNATHQVKIQ